MPSFFACDFSTAQLQLLKNSLTMVPFSGDCSAFSAHDLAGKDAVSLVARSTVASSEAGSLRGR